MDQFDYIELWLLTVLTGQNDQFDQLDRSFDQIDRSFDQIDRSIDQIERSIDQIDRSIDQIDQSIDQIDLSSDQIDQSIDQIDRSIWSIFQNTLTFDHFECVKVYQHWPLWVRNSHFLPKIQKKLIFLPKLKIYFYFYFLLRSANFCSIIASDTSFESLNVKLLVLESIGSLE